MESDAPGHFNPAGSDYGAYDVTLPKHQLEGWTTFESDPKQTLKISPSSQVRRPIEGNDQPNHLEEVFPLDFRWDFAQDPSIAVEPPMDGTVQPEERPNGSQQHQKGSLSHPDTQQPSEKYYNTDDQALLNSVEINSSTLRLLINPVSVKRRRGRPRLHPPVLDIDDHCAYKSGVSDPRESQLEKHRIAADRCRKRKKEYVADLTANASALSSRNKSLKVEEISLHEEVLDLKNEVLRHGGCGS